MLQNVKLINFIVISFEIDLIIIHTAVYIRFTSGLCSRDGHNFLKLILTIHKRKQLKQSDHCKIVQVCTVKEPSLEM